MSDKLSEKKSSPKDDLLSRETQVVFWLGVLLVIGFLIHLLNDVLLPFLAGMAVAYFLDPVADRLEERGLSRTLATSLITLLFFAAVVAGVLVLLPLLENQIVALAKLLPRVIESAKEVVGPYLADLRAELADGGVTELPEAAGAYASKVIGWITAFLAKIWSGGLAFLNLLSILIITPIVSFYLLRDWDKITALLRGLLPRDHEAVILEQCRAIDDTLAGFLRGQATVCLTLGAYYGASLTVVGLNSGLLVGIGAGLISFIPYIGATSGIVVGLAIAFFQFTPANPLPIVAVAAIFIVGQLLEGYVLTPKLVGDKVGLHPVWLIFALLAGGALFGFTGLLLAIPVAAVIGVLIRFGVGRYRESRLYLGENRAITKRADGETP